MLQKLETTSKQRELALASVAFLVAFALWQVQGLAVLTYPLRLFVTMIHELGHGTAAILTGGSFLNFEVTRRGAGLAYTSGGSRFIIIQAGYLGTALFGALLLYLANRTRRPGLVASLLGLFVGILTLLYSDINLNHLSLLETALAAIVIIAALYLILTRETDNGRMVGLTVAVFGAGLLVVFTGWDNLLTVVVGLGSALVLILLGYRANPEITIVVLNFLAFLAGLQAITDAWVLLKIVSMPASMMPLNDASAMAREFGGTATVWAICWVALDILLFGTAVYLTFIRPHRQTR